MVSAAVRSTGKNRYQKKGLGAELGHELLQTLASPDSKNVPRVDGPQGREKPTEAVSIRPATSLKTMAESHALVASPRKPSASFELMGEALHLGREGQGSGSIRAATLRNCWPLMGGSNTAVSMCCDVGILGGSRTRQTYLAKGKPMLWTIALIFLALWALGFATSFTLGGFLHILLVLAVVTVAVRLIQGRRAIP